MVPTDWWIGAHDNRSAVAAVSFCPAFLRREELGRLWQFGKRFNFKVTGKQRKDHKIKIAHQILLSSTLCMACSVGLTIFYSLLVDGSDAEGDAGPLTTAS